MHGASTSVRSPKGCDKPAGSGRETLDDLHILATDTKYAISILSGQAIVETAGSEKHLTSSRWSSV